MRRAEFKKARRLAVLSVLATLLLTSACTPAATAELEGNAMEAIELVVTDMTVPGPGGGSAAANAQPGSVVVPVRTYESGGSETWATLVWAHGGSFVRGTLDWPEADWVARRFAEAGLRVISVDYVLASDEVKAPAPSNDVAAVVAWAGAEYAGPLVVGGASAGAQLAVLATLSQADRYPERTVDALLLEYPTLHRVQRDDPALAAAADGLPEQQRFRAQRIAEMYDFYLGESGTPVAGELPPERLAALPPVTIVNADTDELRASGEQFAEQLRATGVEVSESIQPGTLHGYLNRPDESEQVGLDARATIDHFVRELRRMLER